MSGEERQQLIARYATGMLSAEERERLFAAALEDQALYEELLHEQPLAEVFSGAATRAEVRDLLAPKPRWFRVWWLIPVAAAAGLGVLTFTLARRAAAPVEVAQVRMSETVPAPPVEVERHEPVKPQVSKRLEKRELDRPAKAPANVEPPSGVVGGVIDLRTAPAAPPPPPPAAAPLQESVNTAAPAAAAPRQAKALTPSSAVADRSLSMGYLASRTAPVLRHGIDAGVVTLESDEALIVYLWKRNAENSWTPITPDGIHLQPNTRVSAPRIDVDRSLRTPRVVAVASRSALARQAQIALIDGALDAGRMSETVVVAIEVP